jgi:hypothetical protein
MLKAVPRLQNPMRYRDGSPNIGENSHRVARFSTIQPRNNETYDDAYNHK